VVLTPAIAKFLAKNFAFFFFGLSLFLSPAAAQSPRSDSPCVVILNSLENAIRLRPFARHDPASADELLTRPSSLKKNEVEFYGLGKRNYVVVTQRGAYFFERIGNKRNDSDRPGYYRIKEFEPKDIGFRARIFRSLTSSIPGMRKLLSDAEYRILDDAIAERDTSDSLFENIESDGFKKVRGRVVLRPYLYTSGGVFSRVIGVPTLVVASLFFTPKPFTFYSPYFKMNLGFVPKLVVSGFDKAYLRTSSDRLNIEVNLIDAVEKPGTFDYVLGLRDQFTRTPLSRTGIDIPSAWNWNQTPTRSELFKRDHRLRELKSVLDTGMSETSQMSEFLSALATAPSELRLNSVAPQEEPNLYFSNTLISHLFPTEPVWKADQRLNLPADFIIRILSYGQVQQNPHFLDALVALYSQGLGKTDMNIFRSKMIYANNDHSVEGSQLLGFLATGLLLKENLSEQEFNILKDIALSGANQFSQRATLELVRRHLNKEEGILFLEKARGRNPIEPLLKVLILPMVELPTTSI
jgi:hypothetical protein